MNINQEMDQAFRARVKPYMDIIKLYSCSEACRAFCCQQNKITFGEVERQRILQQYPQNIDLFETQTISTTELIKGDTWKQYEFTTFPCPMLTTKNLCSIQKEKPLICELYPFSTKNIPSFRFLALDPCPMGLDIILDYTLFKALQIIVIAPDEASRNTTLTDLLKMLLKIMKSSKRFFNQTAMNIFMPVEDAIIFKKFIEGCPQEKLIESREFLKNAKNVKEMTRWIKSGA